MTEPVVRAHVFQGFDGFASRKGLDFDALLRDAGLSREALADPDNEISLNAAAQVLTDAAARSNDPCLGLHWAEAFPKGGSGVLGYLLLNAKTVRVAVKTIARCTALHIDPIDISFSEQDGGGRLEWRFPSSFVSPRIQYASFIMALTVIRLRRLVGPGWSPKGVALEHRELPCREDILRVLGPNARFDQTANAIELREEILDRTYDAADTRLFHLIQELANRLLAERKSQSDIVWQTRCAIVRTIETGDVTLEDIAGQLELSSRVLQSRLSASSVTYEEVLQETRRELTETYLRDTDLSLTEIALLLGFSELSAFTRAAVRWFGVPPSTRRAALRQPAQSTLG